MPTAGPKGKVKMNQNRPAAYQPGVVEGLRLNGLASVARVQSPESMRKLRDTNREVIERTDLQQRIEGGRRPALKQIDIDAGIQQQRQSGLWCRRYKRKELTRASRERCGETFRPNSTKGASYIKRQA